MADLAATDLTLVVLPTDRAVVTSASQNVNTGLTGAQGVIMGKQRMQRVRITLPSGPSVHASGGIPLPTFGATTPGNMWGMVRNLDYVVLIGENVPAAGQHFLWKYHPGSHSIAGYHMAATAYSGVATGFPVLPTTWSPATTYEWTFQAWGW